MTNHVSAENALVTEAGRYVAQINAGLTRAAGATVKLAILALREYSTRKGALALASVEGRLPGAIKQRLALFLSRASGGGIQYTRGHFVALGLRGYNFKVAIDACNASITALAGARELPAPAPAPEAPAPEAPAPAPEFDASAALARLIKRAERANALADLRAACMQFVSPAPEAPAPEAPAPVKVRRRK